MRKQRKIVITAISGVAALSIGASLIIGGSAATGGVWQLPAELQQGLDTAAENPATGAKVTTDKFDNVQKKTGEQAGLVDETTKKTYFTVKIAKSQLLNSCPDRMGGPNLKPERSKFLVLDIEASLEDNVASKVGGSKSELYMPLLAEAFSVVDAKGGIDRSVASDAAWGCYKDSQLAPAIINPGENVRGKIVLDIAANKGKVAYDPEDNGGWSWPFGG